ncbi:MAG: ATP-dependent DNA helicase [Gimesia sp.]|uniref:DNA 3'-5' helicase n=1 Tax=Gimesia maris TaxID=122 RepID=A0A3D3R5Y0_9PLAN|nr:ATP-dependent DNA helicase [Gimesia sp.]HCO23427.1 ATP-dependent helicase [Gimesia maris]|tara:strand:+ start:6631 stop:8373 length:1743 start_codon:yes stop_codon:yes gene_type:complete
MKLTPEQKNALKHQGNVVLEACPGSGKTRTIIAKLLRSVDNIRETPRRIACITYTNAAVYEIENRIRVFGTNGDDEYCDVSTIHAFCLNNILRYHHWRIDTYKEGFTVLPSDSEDYKDLVREIADRYGIDTFARTMFESLSRKPDGTPIVPPEIPKQAALEFWNILESKGLIDFCNIIYYSYCILRDNPSLVSNLASRFKFIFVDEFQDTSALQVEILTLIYNQGKSEFFLVGDPEQSIYSFAGAEPNLMSEFSESIGATKFSLTGNFRSSTPVVDCAETLIPRTPEMFAAGSAKAFNEIPYYEHFENNFLAITEGFIPQVEALGIPFGEVAILAPQWRELLNLARELRHFPLPIVGPGARPYKKRHLFASLAEQLCAYAEDPSPDSISPVEKDLFFLVQQITGKPNFRIFSYEGRKVIFKLFYEALRLKEEHEGARDWLLAASQSMSKILTTEELIPSSAAHLMHESTQDILSDMERNEIDLENLTLNDLGMFANPKDSIKMMTMHSAKGREFMAVAIISAIDGMIPYHNKHNLLTREKLEEGRRLFYVSITRSKRLLTISTRDDWRSPSPYISDIGMI